MNIKLDTKVLLYWRSTAAVIFAAVFSAFVLALRDRPYVRLSLCVFSAAVFAAVAFLYMPRLFKITGVSVQNGRIIFKKGILFRREYIYPNARLVYLQTVKLPIASCFGLRFLILRGAGNSLVLPPVTAAQSETLRKAVECDE